MNAYKAALFIAAGILIAHHQVLACRATDNQTQTPLFSSCEAHPEWTNCLVLRKCGETRNDHISGNVTFESEAYFQDRLLGDVINLHNQHLQELENWRRLFAQYADELAHFVKTFPGAEALDEDILRDTFAARTGLREHVTGGEVFQPWAHRWSGMWSNGSSQYHIWDQTQYWNGRWIQAVTQSEAGFTDGSNLEAMFARNQVDLGINVYTAETGITGWVSKRQHGRLEVPHIGYLVDATTLIWICQQNEPDRLFQKDSTWFIYLEKVDSLTNAQRYTIYGHPFVIDGTVRWQAQQRGQHCGIYQARRRIGVYSG